MLDFALCLPRFCIRSEFLDGFLEAASRTGSRSIPVDCVYHEPPERDQSFPSGNYIERTLFMRLCLRCHVHLTLSGSVH